MEELDSLDNDDDRPLTADERKALRAILENDRRARWFWATARLVAGWITAAIIGAAAVQTAVQHWIDALTKKVQ